MITQQQFDALLHKLEKMKQSGGADLSTEEDLSVAVMNLISLEEHFFFTGAKTKQEEYFDLLLEARNMRKDLLAKMIDKNEGETWCISKHLLATAMRLIEVGTKLHSDGKRDESKNMFEKAYRTYAMFWALRLKLIDPAGFKKIAAGESAEQSKDKKPWTFEDIVNKMVDCCDEK